MAIKIGHASLDERKKIKGGSAGDQTGSEVCTRTWYNGSWGFVLRPRDALLAEKSAQACEKGCANNNIGYDQNQRNTLYAQAQKVGYDLSKITTPCECDCSSFMHVCALAGGACIPYSGNGATTSTMRNKFSESGKYDVLTDSKYLTSDKYLRRGDILVRPGHHTVMVLESGKNVQQVTGNPYPVPTRVLYRKTPMMFGNDVRWLQTELGIKADGFFGNDTKNAVISYQKAHGLTQDGKVGPATRNCMLND
jgi:peptidoglycan hydrolase-like protein with peptidoglycan-binding domain